MKMGFRPSESIRQSTVSAHHFVDVPSHKLLSEITMAPGFDHPVGVTSRLVVAAVYCVTEKTVLMAWVEMCLAVLARRGDTPMIGVVGKD